MVVEVIEDLDSAAVGQLPVGEVALPHLVGERRLEADEGATWSLVGLWGDQPLTLEDAPDSGHRGGVQRLQSEVVGDGVRAAVVPCPVQLLAQLEDRPLDLGGHGMGHDAGRRERGSRAGSPPSR